MSQLRFAFRFAYRHSFRSGECWRFLSMFRAGLRIYREMNQA